MAAESIKITSAAKKSIPRVALRIVHPKNSIYSALGAKRSILLAFSTPIYYIYIRIYIRLSPALVNAPPTVNRQFFQKPARSSTRDEESFAVDKSGWKDIHIRGAYTWHLEGPSETESLAQCALARYRPQFEFQ